jgi:glycosyltransferase involved in cell wall biosynthesis
MVEKVTIIVPAHNEELYIGNLLPSLQNLQGWGTSEFEVRDVIVVDDGSADRTAAVARKAGFRVIRLDKNRGKTFAFFKGAEVARRMGATVIVTLDADLREVTREQIGLLLQPILHSTYSASIGTVEFDTDSSSGQRAIRMKALEPLFQGNRKWCAYFGIRKGNFYRRIGFGLEQSLNILLGPIAQFVEHLPTAPRPHSVIANTLFRTQRFFGTRNPLAVQDIEINRVRAVYSRRKEWAQALRKMRERGKAKYARELFRRRKQRYLR